MDKSGRALTFDAHCFSIGAVQAEEPPECDGKSATIYVLDGVIVGGPDNGKPFKGVLMGTPGGDVIVGTAGDDIILGLAGNDTICGGPGDDELPEVG